MPVRCGVAEIQYVVAAPWLGPRMRRRAQLPNSRSRISQDRTGERPGHLG